MANMEVSTNFSDAQHDYCSGIVIGRLFISLSVTYFTASVLSIFVSVVVAISVRKTTLFPENVKLLLTNVTVGATVASIGMFVKAIYSIAVSFRQSDIVGHPVVWCTLLMAPETASSGAVSMFIVGIGVDRFRATRKMERNSNFQNEDASKKFIRVYVVCVWIFMTLTVLINSVKDFNSEACYCSMMTILDEIEETVCVLAFVSFHAVALALFLYVYRKNKRAYMRFNLTTSSHDLHHRYQLTNNMKSTTMIIPYVIVHLITSSVQLIVYLFYKQLIATDDDNDRGNGNVSAFLDFDMIFTNTVVLDLVVSPLLWLRYHESLKKAACTSFPFLSRLLNYNIDASASISSLNRVVMVKTVNVVEHANRTETNRQRAFNYRVRPERADEILQNIWATKAINEKH